MKIVNLVLISLTNLVILQEALAGLTPHVVIGDDKRVRLNDSHYPWSTFGKVKSGPDANGINVLCSGTLIGPRHVITSAHCIDVNFPYYFYPSFHNGDYAESIEQVETRVMTVYSASGVYDISPNHAPLPSLQFSRETDWAILVLNSDVGNIFGWQEPIEWKETWVNKPIMYNVAYPIVDISNWYGTYPMLNKSCTVRSDTESYFWHDCATNGGSSGSSITTIIGDKSYVIGIHNTGYGYDYCNYFQPEICANGAIKSETFLPLWNILVGYRYKTKF